MGRRARAAWRPRSLSGIKPRPESHAKILIDLRLIETQAGLLM
jgi:hypothetical protein